MAYEAGVPSVSHPYTTPGTTYVGDIPQPFFRDDMDAHRSMWRRTPEAEYPSGYLGTIKSRREDRLLNAVKNKVNKKSYDRGVHVGERIDRSEYFWPERSGLGLMDGIMRQAVTPLRFAPRGDLAPVTLINDGKAPTPGKMSYAVVDPVRQAQMRRMGPTWR